MNDNLYPCLSQLDSLVLADLKQLIAEASPSCCGEERLALLELCAESVIFGLERSESPVREAMALCREVLASLWGDLPPADQRRIYLATAKAATMIYLSCSPVSGKESS